MNAPDRIEWPLPGAALAGDAQSALSPAPLLERAALVAAIKAGPAVEAFATKRAVQILTHGHTPERDLEESIALLAYEAKARLNAFTEIMPLGRMNLPPLRREQCLRYVEIAGGILIALWDRCQVEVPE
jgi:hypothetical protein